MWFEPFSNSFQELIRRAIIEEPFVLLEEETEGFDGHFVVFSQVAFCLIPEIIDAVDVIVSVGTIRE